jgi:LysR family positive regulator for ilvC
MVSMGFGIGIVPELILRKNFINRNVQVLDIKPELMRYSVGICVQKKRMANPMVKAFWENI